jgi:hypothetical protein
LPRLQRTCSLFLCCGFVLSSDYFTPISDVIKIRLALLKLNHIDGRTQTVMFKAVLLLGTEREAPDGDKVERKGDEPRWSEVRCN